MRHIKLSIFIISVSLLAGCKKSDEQRVNESFGFRPATCQDTTDDGRYEQYNEKENNSFINPNDYEDPGFPDIFSVFQISLTNREIAAPSDNKAILEFGCTKRVHLKLMVPFSAESIKGAEYDFDSSKKVSVDLSDIGVGGYPRDCSRLFYIFSEEIPQTGKYKVITKGHFDVSIK